MLSLSINAKAIKPVKSLYDYKQYQQDLESGFYIVPECLVDGAEPTSIWLIYWSADTRIVVSSMLIPPHIERLLEVRQDKEDALQNLHTTLDEVKYSLFELKEALKASSLSSSNLDSNTLLRALAIAQKPELIKDI